MKDPDPGFELKILRDVVEQARDPRATLDKQQRWRTVLTTIGSVGLTIAFLLALGSSLWGFLIAVTAGASGIALGFGVFFKFTQDQWPLTVRYVDLQRIEERIKVLES